MNIVNNACHGQAVNDQLWIFVSQDVAMKVMSFSQQQGPQAVCILSANGAISNATLRQPATSGGMVTYEVGC